MERREPRGALAATIDVGGTPLHVLAAHLGLRIHERRFQVRQILEYLDSVRNTLLVVLGDFNDWLPGRSVVHVLDRPLGRPPRPASFPVLWPIVALDRIWVHPTAALRRIFTHATPTARLASDHLPVVAEIDDRLIVPGRDGLPTVGPVAPAKRRDEVAEGTEAHGEARVGDAGPSRRRASACARRTSVR